MPHLSADLLDAPGNSLPYMPCSEGSTERNDSDQAVLLVLSVCHAAKHDAGLHNTADSVGTGKGEIALLGLGHQAVTSAFNIAWRWGKMRRDHKRQYIRSEAPLSMLLFGHQDADYNVYVVFSVRITLTSDRGLVSAGTSSYIQVRRQSVIWPAMLSLWAM
ncbi:hypothetical protein P280DRAFT_274737 [Massarina eburnea CBS 473.64]|uniref:Uncharacterized protein n=1 Tax=Massarina eburnea CBS 473.64 TaxID=1395130 RepID=A0A6A6S703_9PLEO|nr:hypothetical protein P280DRAFT_274737 [Massarina eburnea CBS 473.64]